MQLGYYLKMCREKQNWTRLKVAEKSGLSTQTLIRLENGQTTHPPHKDVLEKLAKGYEVDYNTLVDIIYGPLNATKQKQKKAPNTQPIPIVSNALFIKLLLAEEPTDPNVYEHTLSIPKQEGYFCATQIQTQNDAPYLPQGAHIITKTSDTYNNGDWVVLANETFQEFHVMQLFENENACFLKSLTPTSNTLGFTVTIDIQRRILGRVVRVVWAV